MRTSNTQKGFYLVEIVVASAIILLVSVALFTAFALYLKVAATNTEKIQAVYLAEEGIEAVRSIRDRDWNLLSSLTQDTTHYLDWSSSMWQSTSTSVFVEGVFERGFVISEVLRDVDTDDIGAVGVVDMNARMLTVTVSWFGASRATSTISISTYLTNIHE